MIRKDLRRIISWILAVVWMCVIFGFSGQTGGESGGLSAKIVEVVLNIFNISQTENNFNTLQFIIRKLAHGTEYFILGVLLFNAIYNTLHNIKNTTILAFVFCIIYSITDEIHQLFIPGRVGSIKDCLIDSTGSMLGILFCLFIIYIMYNFKKE